MYNSVYFPLYTGSASSGHSTSLFTQSQLVRGTVISGRPFELRAALRLTYPAASNWKVIGTLLGISSEILSRIASNEARVEDRLVAVLNESSHCDPLPTWEDLANVVEPFNPNLAERIRHTWSSNQQLQ